VIEYKRFPLIYEDLPNPTAVGMIE
jgi:hypothetical protein